MNRLHGFTIIELLIALFIFTIISVMMASGLHTIFHTQSTITKYTNRLSELQMALLFLSRDITQIVDRPITNAKGIAEPAFSGTSNHIALTHAGLANPLEQLHRSTLQHVTYHTEQDHLMRDTWSVLDQRAKTLPSSRILLNNVKDVRFEYLNEENRYQNHWPSTDQHQKTFPKGIRITITIKNWGKISQLYLLPNAL